MCKNRETLITFGPHEDLNNYGYWTLPSTFKGRAPSGHPHGNGVRIGSERLGQWGGKAHFWDEGPARVQSLDRSYPPNGAIAHFGERYSPKGLWFGRGFLAGFPNLDIAQAGYSAGNHYGRQAYRGGANAQASVDARTFKRLAISLGGPQRQSLYAGESNGCPTCVGLFW